MQSEMPEIISSLDDSHHLREGLSPELGVTDPMSTSVVFEA